MFIEKKIGKINLTYLIDLKRMKFINDSICKIFPISFFISVDLKNRYT